MITGPDAITQMRKLDDLINELRNLMPDDMECDCLECVAEYFADRLKEWRDEIIKEGGIKPLQSYTELLSHGDKL